jgi:hypothetical protein
LSSFSKDEGLFCPLCAVGAVECGSHAAAFFPEAMLPGKALNLIRRAWLG